MSGDKADIVVHAAVEEGFGNAVLEAQAMEVPVVAADAGGLVENVADGITGFIVPRRNPRARAEKVIFLAGRPELRRRMGQAGRQRVLEKFAIGDQIDRFCELYNGLIPADAPVPPATMPFADEVRFCYHRWGSSLN